MSRISLPSNPPFAHRRVFELYRLSTLITLFFLSSFQQTSEKRCADVCTDGNDEGTGDGGSRCPNVPILWGVDEITIGYT
jgi:hypothetical protein